MINRSLSMSRCTAALTAALWCVSLPASAQEDDTAAMLVQFQNATCASPVATPLSQVDFGSDWREAQDEDREALVELLADFATRIDFLTNQQGDADPKAVLAGHRLRWQRAILATDPAAPQARIMRHTTVGALTSALYAEQAEGESMLSCTLVLQGPSEDLVDGLARRFEVMPVYENALTRHWQARDAVTSPDGETRDALRSLTLRLSPADQSVTHAVLTYRTTLARGEE
ncbi:hypothetical protein SSE37_11319 [Sagittula stellata E-37]|uniref:Uncharacterized protein n=2 Tax=Sagittula stellata TaxID=52603 RepID=A3K3L6_SAGS3|nr:hypothetical protein SSE37_11319 [Sagittula stellata E-37]